MSVALAALAVMDTELPLWFIFFGFITIGAIGMLASRRRPILCGLFIAVALLGAFALYLEFSDFFVAKLTIREGGFVYLAGCGAAIFAGIGMPLFGASAGTRKLSVSAASWRWISGAAGAVLLGSTLFIGSRFVESVYDEYILYPREKAGEGYIMPLRWQDIVMEVAITVVLIGLFLLSAYLMRFAFRPKTKRTLKISANS
jgi:hypothetical protein